MPLLEEIKIEPPESECIAEETNYQQVLDTKQKKAKDNGKEEKGVRKGSHKENEPTIYDAEDEYETEKRMGIKNTSFKTERKGWSNNIEFPEETLVVKCLGNGLVAIRDTFRSCVNVKIVYQKVLHLYNRRYMCT